MRKIKSGVVVAKCSDGAYRKGKKRNTNNDEPLLTGEKLADPYQEKRKKYVELFLDSKRPSVQERLHRRWSIEITGLMKEVQI